MRAAFDQICDWEMLPMQQADECAVRRVIDKAAAQALEVEGCLLAEWRRKLAAEPTITNALAEEGHP